MEGHVLEYIFGAAVAAQGEMPTVCPIMCWFRGLTIRFSLFMVACIAVRIHKLC